MAKVITLVVVLRHSLKTALSLQICKYCSLDHVAALNFLIGSNPTGYFIVSSLLPYMEQSFHHRSKISVKHVQPGALVQHVSFVTCKVLQNCFVY